MAQPEVISASNTLSPTITSKLFWRIVPLLFLLVLLNYIDRSNLGFAALQMNSQLGFTPQVYGTGASIFFIGYLNRANSANLMTHKFGARRVIAWIMIAWGLVAAAMALINDTTSFYSLRFLLAIAEAGMIPGATLYVSQWFPQRERGRAIGTLYTATALAVVIAGPVSGAILEMPGWLGLKPWQWMFILEAAPTIVIGLFIGRILSDDPNEASWLDAGERNELTTILAQERRNVGALGQRRLVRFGELARLGLVRHLFLHRRAIPRHGAVAPADHPPSAEPAALRDRPHHRDPLFDQRCADGRRRPALGPHRHARALRHRRPPDRLHRHGGQRLSDREPDLVADRPDRRHRRLPCRWSGRFWSFASGLPRGPRRRGRHRPARRAAARSAASSRPTCSACSASASAVSKPGFISWPASASSAPS